MVAQWGLPDKRVHHVPLVIDAEFFPPQPWPDDRGLVVSAGADRVRDYNVLVEGVGRARSRVVEAHLTIATSQPPAARPDLVIVHRKRMNGTGRALYRRRSIVAVALHSTWLGSGLKVVLTGLASASPVVVTDPEEAREMGRRGRELVGQGWTTGRMAESLANLVSTTWAGTK